MPTHEQGQGQEHDNGHGHEHGRAHDHEHGRGHDDQAREFDLSWADDAEHKEPSARARMLAERWKHQPPGPVPFRPDPTPSRSRRVHRSPWVSTAIVLGCVVLVILLIGYLNTY